MDQALSEGVNDSIFDPLGQRFRIPMYSVQEDCDIQMIADVPHLYRDPVSTQVCSADPTMIGLGDDASERSGIRHVS